MLKMVFSATHPKSSTSMQVNSQAQRSMVETVGSCDATATVGMALTHSEYCLNYSMKS